jgi:hypothetical protein
MKRIIFKKTALRIAALLMMLTFSGCISATPKIVPDVESTVNSVVSDTTSSSSTANGQSSLSLPSLINPKPSGGASSVPSEFFPSSQMSALSKNQKARSTSWGIKTNSSSKTNYSSSSSSSVSSTPVSSPSSSSSSPGAHSQAPE